MSTINILNAIQLTDYFRVFYEFVQYYPVHDEKCKRLHTWAALENMSDLNAENLAKVPLEREKVYFYSRSWAKSEFNPSNVTFDYPVMVAVEEDIPLDGFLMDGPMKTCYNLNIAFLDKFDEACSKKGTGCTDCAKRNRYEIYRDTEIFLRVFESYLRGLVITTTGVLINQAVNQLLNNVDVDTVKTRQFKKMLRDHINVESAIRWEGGKDDLVGIFIPIRLCVKTCEEFVYDPKESNLTIGIDKNCCD